VFAVSKVAHLDQRALAARVVVEEHVFQLDVSVAHALHPTHAAHRLSIGWLHADAWLAE
jgi:hypothetical protein